MFLLGTMIMFPVAVRMVVFRPFMSTTRPASPLASLM